MAQVEFHYKGITTTIECKLEQKMDNIFNKFISKTIIKEKEINYYYYDKIVSQNDKNLTFNQIANSLDKQRKKICVLVYDNNIEEPNEILIRSKNIICPECNRDIKMKINNRYNIDLYGRQNNHEFNNILIKDFEKTQMINIKNIKYNLCVLC